MEKRLSHPDRTSDARIELEEEIAAMREQLCRDVETFTIDVLGEIASQESVIQGLLMNSINLLEAGTASAIVSFYILDSGCLLLDVCETTVDEANSEFDSVSILDSDSDVDSSSTSGTDWPSSGAHSDLSEATEDGDHVQFDSDSDLGSTSTDCDDTYFAAFLNDYYGSLPPFDMID